MKTEEAQTDKAGKPAQGKNNFKNIFHNPFTEIALPKDHAHSHDLNEALSIVLH